MRLLAPAKINLTLRVGKPRADGFHPLCSWMCSVGLFDTLTLTRAVRGDGFTLSCGNSSLPADRSNLVVRAAEALAETRSRNEREGAAKLGGVSATLDKQIPMGAGLGGGSSDANRTLLGLSSLWNLRLPAEEFARIGGSLGSDVPFFMHLPSAICTGRGEIIRAISAPRPKWCVLIFPPFSIATPAVYRRFDELALGSDLTAEPDWQHWTELDAARLLPMLVNDLEPPAFSIRPELGDLRERIERRLNWIVRMSGSGSSLFTLFDEELRGKETAETISAEFDVQAICVELAPIIRDDLHDDRHGLVTVR